MLPLRFLFDKRKEAGDLAGTTAPNLRDRCLGLSRLPERQNVQNRAPASRQMQESAGVDEMSTGRTTKPICPASCEKSSLFRQGVLLPKIEFTPITPSRTCQSIMFLASIVEQSPLTTDTRDTILPASRYVIITSTLLKRHSSRHAA